GPAGSPCQHSRPRRAWQAPKGGPAPARSDQAPPGVSLVPVAGKQDPSKGAAVSNDAIVLLKEDHKRVRKLFRQFQDAGEGAKATKGKRVDQTLKKLTGHTYPENEAMNPKVRNPSPAREEDWLGPTKKHHSP